MANNLIGHSSDLEIPKVCLLNPLFLTFFLSVHYLLLRSFRWVLGELGVFISAREQMFFLPFNIGKKVDEQWAFEHRLLAWPVEEANFASLAGSPLSLLLNSLDTRGIKQPRKAPHKLNLHLSHLTAVTA